MPEYIEGVDRDLIHRAWVLREEAKRHGKKATVVGILNAVLRDTLTDANMEALKERFCKEMPCRS
jgi:hypothetical protein